MRVSMLTSAIEQAGERLLIAIDLNRVEILALRRIVMAVLVVAIGLIGVALAAAVLSLLR